MQDILKTYYASGGKTLFESQILLEYDRATTIAKWGDRLIKAAFYNSKTNLGDSFFDLRAKSYRNPDHPDGKWIAIEVMGDEIKKLGNVSSHYLEMEKANAEKFRPVFLNDLLQELEKMDPTENKQYVMWLVRAYVQSIEGFNTVLRNIDYTPAQYMSAMADTRSGYADPNMGMYDDGTNMDYEPEDLIEDPYEIDSFRLEDINQVNDTLVTFHRIKPQLPVEQRDINRYKTFRRLQDFVDDAIGGNSELTQEIDNEILKRPDVEVLYNGPLGTVTIPRSYKASCELGRGTRWCTASKNSRDNYDYYSDTGDLIIYNEKPGNQKYQIHVTIANMEMRDARDRLISPDQVDNFRNSHPVLSKILKQNLEDQYYRIGDGAYQDGPDLFPDDSYVDIDKLIEKLIELNQKRGGGVMQYLDEYFISEELPYFINTDMYGKFAIDVDAEKWADTNAILQKQKSQSGPADPNDPNYVPGTPKAVHSLKPVPHEKLLDQVFTYAKQRKKPWPQMRKLMMQILYQSGYELKMALETFRFDATKVQNIKTKLNLYLKSINRVVTALETLGRDAELDKFKNDMIQLVQRYKL